MRRYLRHADCGAAKLILLTLAPSPYTSREGVSKMQSWSEGFRVEKPINDCENQRIGKGPDARVHLRKRPQRRIPTKGGLKDKGRYHNMNWGSAL